MVVRMSHPITLPDDPDPGVEAAAATSQRLIAAAVSARLRESRIPQRTVSAKTGIPMTTLVRRLAGHGKAFDINELARIAALLDVSVAALITYAEAAA
jgi:hypothetical protein